MKRFFSLEIFPPKRTAPVETIYRTLDGLRFIQPDFISVTYGAGGSANVGTTLEIARTVQNDYHIPAVAHLPGLHLTQGEVLDILARFNDVGLHDILALRGDPVENAPLPGDFPYASDLIRFIKKNGAFNVFAACYPETHPQAESEASDFRHLKEKVEAGANRLITQLFFDNDKFFRFRDIVRALDINVPIEAGIMPVINSRQIERMLSLCHASFPPKFKRLLEHFGDSPVAMRDAGIAYAVNQIVDLLVGGVDGIHLYTMNNPDVAQEIYSRVVTLIRS
ncbi:MAG: methylenetetrahydrofolate reductase [NAD(P)H] [Kiritimatiellia bacterium]